MTILKAVEPVPFNLHGLREITVPTPAMGGKCWLLEEKGLFVLQRGAGVLRTIACTHAGSGSIEAIDGVPDDRGFFDDLDMQAPLPGDFETPDAFKRSLKRYAERNGRCIYRATPVVMGSWMLDAGFFTGLTIRAAGGMSAASAIASIVWMPVKAKDGG